MPINYLEGHSPRQLVVTEDNRELVDWSFKELCEKILVDRKLKINRHIAYGVQLAESGKYDDKLVIRWRTSKARVTKKTISQ
jgi:hypothetical protein